MSSGLWRNGLRMLRHDPEELLYLAGEVARTPALAARRYELKARGEKPIGYIGWLGHRNLGDEAMFQAVTGLLAGFPTEPFIAPPGERLLASLGLGGPGYFRAVLLGGGTLINPLYLPAVRLARSYGAPVYTAGTGVGSAGFGMPPGVPLEGWREVLAEAEFVAVRGPLSRERLEAEGIGNALVTGDPALSLTSERVPEFRTRVRLAINLAREAGKAHSPAEEAILAALREIAKEFTGSGGEVVGVALGGGDYRALEEFRAAAGLSGMRIESHRREAAGLLGTLEGSVGLIGVRLHSAVLACCVGVPAVVLAYRGKCEDFMSSMGLPEFAVPVAEEKSPVLLRERWQEVLSRGELGQRIYRTALAWKGVQRGYFERMSERLRARGSD